MKSIKTNYNRIKDIALKLGAKETSVGGIYIIKGKTVDLTASGNAILHVAKNIIDQI